MEVLLLFTHPDRLSGLGVKNLNWDVESQPIIVVDIDTTRSVWIIWDKTDIGILLRSFESRNPIRLLFYAYHRFPPETYLDKLECYLTSNGIIFEKNKANHLANIGSVYECIACFPPTFTEDEYLKMKEKIFSIEKYRSRLLNLFNQRERILKNEFWVNEYPIPMQEYYKACLAGINDTNFNDRLVLLKRQLKDYCAALRERLTHG